MKEKIRILLDWKQDAKHAIFNNMDVVLIEPEKKSKDSLGLVQRGEAELAINYPHNMMVTRAEHPDVISIGALVKRNTEGLLSLSGTGIKSPQDIKGHKVGIGPNPVNRAQLEVFFAENNLNPAEINVETVGFNGEQLLLEKKIDLLDAVAYAIIRTQRKGFEVNFIPFAGHGVPDSPFLVFAAHRVWAEKHRDIIKRFFARTKAGIKKVSNWGKDEWVKYTAPLKTRQWEEEKAVWESTLPLVLGEGKLFYHSTDELEKLKNILLRKGILKEDFSIEEMFPNTYID